MEAKLETKIERHPTVIKPEQRQEVSEEEET